MIIETKVYNRDDDKDIAKNLFTYFIFLKKFFEVDYLNFDAKNAFNFLWKTFILILVFHNFYSKCHIFFKTNEFGHIIDIVIN